MNSLIYKKDLNKLIKVKFYPEKRFTFHKNMFLILLIYRLIDVIFDFPAAYSRKYTFLIKPFLKW